MDDVEAIVSALTEYFVRDIHDNLAFFEEDGIALLKILKSKGWILTTKKELDQLHQDAWDGDRHWKAFRE